MTVATKKEDPAASTPPHGTGPHGSSNPSASVTGRTPSEVSANAPIDALRARLAALAVELTGFDRDHMLDVDGDLQLRDNPFCIFARVATTQRHPEPRLIFVVVPLLEVRTSERLLDLVDRALSGRADERTVANNAIQFFCPFSVSVLDKLDDFRHAYASALSLGEAVIAAVQPECGGLTAVQQRVLRGWQAYDPGIETEIRAITEQAGGKLLTHGWNPRNESLPLLANEEWDDGREADHFVTVDASGCVRLRRKMADRRDGEVGIALIIHELSPGAARTWAQRMGSAVPSGPVTADELRGLTPRSWREMIGALAELSHTSGDVWKPRKLRLGREVPVDFADRTEAARVATRLDSLGMPVATFHSLHHRETLRPSDTVAVHVKWLSKGTARLGLDHERLARRMQICLSHRLSGDEWSAAAAKALREVPK